MTTLIAKHTVKANGKFVEPGRPFEVEDDDVVGELIARGAADRKTRVVDDSEDDDEIMPIADVIAMADQKGVSTAKFRKAAAHHLGDDAPTKKAEILAALKALPPDQQQ